MEVHLNGILSEREDQYLVKMKDITDQKLTEKVLKRRLSEPVFYFILAITGERKMIALKSEINVLLVKM
jgi:hypothetical protein